MADTARRDVPLLWRALNAVWYGWLVGCLTGNQCHLTVTSASRYRQERDGRYGASRCSTTVEGAERGNQCCLTVTSASRSREEREADTARRDVPLLWRALNAVWCRLVNGESMPPHRHLCQ
ncbi:hypothetical protein J6590_033948 [Homalodisca vitripennis]|nr:hypothetical protein J6590_033948 [Homalodisca vitripennis]